MEQKDKLRAYFAAWLQNDIKIVKNTFSEDAVYTECYGPEYHGLSQILQWFTDWNQRGRVLEWRIKRMLEQDGSLVAEWYFSCNYDGEIGGFDGVTVADFNADGKIHRLCEYQSKAEHYYPYQK